VKIYMPWLGEFGSELLKWVPKIYANNDADVVCCELGKEVLYPRTKGLFGVSRVNEAQRHCSGYENEDFVFQGIRQRFGDEHKYIYPNTIPSPKGTVFEPELPYDYDIHCDITLFPRWRHTGARKNWPHWSYLCQALQGEGLKVFACGHGDSSLHIPCPSAWDFNGQDLNASIYAIKHSKIRIGNMGALGVLSLMCGKKPWIITSEKSYHTDRRGDACNWAYYEFADHKEVGWKVLPWLDEPERIVKECLNSLS
jgi:hypothetical protein